MPIVIGSNSIATWPVPPDSTLVTGHAVVGGVNSAGLSNIATTYPYAEGDVRVQVSMYVYQSGIVPGSTRSAFYKNGVLESGSIADYCQNFTITTQNHLTYTDDNGANYYSQKALSCTFFIHSTSLLRGYSASATLDVTIQIWKYHYWNKPTIGGTFYGADGPYTTDAASPLYLGSIPSITPPYTQQTIGLTKNCVFGSIAATASCVFGTSAAGKSEIYSLPGVSVPVNQLNWDFSMISTVDFSMTTEAVGFDSTATG